MSYRLGRPGIMLMCFWVPFLVISRNSTITSTMVVLRCHIFIISISKSFYLLMLLYYLTEILLSNVTNISIRRNYFSFIVLNHSIWSIALYFPISFDIKIPENSRFFFFYYWLCFVFIQFCYPIFQSIYILSNQCNVLFYHAFLYTVLVLRFGNRTRNGPFIQFWLAQSTYWVRSIFW